MATRRFTLILSAAILVSVIARSGDAASMVTPMVNQLTFSGPVGLPGITLPGGAYTFELLPLRPDIVRVHSRDGSMLYFTGFVTHVERPRSLRADRLVTFAETPRGVAPRIDIWYPIGASVGHQFIYPEGRR
jgi:hypothetical protein